MKCAKNHRITFKRYIKQFVMTYGENFQSPAMTLTLVRQCPVLNTSKFFDILQTFEFQVNWPSIFSYRAHTHTHTHTFK